MNGSYENWVKDFSNAFPGLESIPEKVFCAFLIGGHVLLEGPPGLGKTSFAKLFAQKLSLDFRRVQMTSDLLPGDVLGFMRYSPKAESFELRKGPVFTDILLVDELNRSSARAQSSLLEAMEEHAVTVDNETLPLSPFFFVIATQNPSEMRGVIPLSESQLDRFCIKISLNYPNSSDQMRLLRQHLSQAQSAIQNAPTVFDRDQLTALRSEIQKVGVEESLILYVTKICERLREESIWSLGMSVRASKQWLDMARARAFLHKRKYVIPEDLMKDIREILGHRVLVDGKQNDSILDKCITEVQVPS